MTIYHNKSRLEQLKAFCAVVECDDSVTLASKKLNISQPSISLKIKSLEYTLKYNLFDRIGRRLKLNPNGQAYYQEVKEALISINKVYNGIAGQRNIGRIRVIPDKLQGEVTLIMNFIIVFNTGLFRFTWKRFLVALGLITSVIIYCYSNHAEALNDSKIKRYFDISKGIAKNIEDMDIYMTKNLEANLKIFTERTRKNPRMSYQQLIELKNELGVSILTYWDKQGKMFLNTNGTHLPSGEDYEKFRNYSIFDKEQCPDFKNMQKIPGSIRTLPLYYSSVRNIPNKLSIVWDNKTQRYLNISYDGQPIKDILDANKSINGDISYIAFSDPSGKIISDSGVKPNGFSVLKYNGYNAKLQIKELDNLLVVTMMFGGLQKELCYQINRGNVNDNNEYFYILTVVFKE